jgi:hypothetical protein
MNETWGQHLATTYIEGMARHAGSKKGRILPQLLPLFAILCTTRTIFGQPISHMKLFDPSA